MLLAEEIVELGEDGDVAGGFEDGVEVEFGVAEVEVAVGEEEGVAAVAVVVELEGGVVAAGAESAFDGGGEAVAVYSTAKKPVLGGRRKGRLPTRGERAPMGMPGRLGLMAGGDVVGGEGLLDEGGEVGVAAAEEEMVEGLVLDFELEALGAVGERVE